MKQVWGAAIAQWIRLHLPSCRLGFESQAHHLRFLQSNFVLCCHCVEERTKINKKEAGFGPIFKQKSTRSLLIKRAFSPLPFRSHFCLRLRCFLKCLIVAWWGKTFQPKSPFNISQQKWFQSRPTLKGANLFNYLLLLLLWLPLNFFSVETKNQVLKTSVTRLGNFWKFLVLNLLT